MWGGGGSFSLATQAARVSAACLVVGYFWARERNVPKQKAVRQPLKRMQQHTWYPRAKKVRRYGDQVQKCFFPEALRRVLLLKAAANFTCQLLMPTCRELFHLPTSHANLSRVTSPANFSCQLVESYFTCQLLMPTCRELLHLPTSHANLSRVTSPADFSCQLFESYFTCQLLMSTFRLLSHSTKSTS